MSMATTLFGLGAVIAILCGYFAPKYMPLPKPKIVGIDLGTTSSCIGVYQPGSGEVLILKDDNGNACIPSVVAFVDNKIHVGHDAMRMASYNPRETVYDAKRFIGKTMTPAFLAEESQRYPFAMKHDVNGSIVFVIPGYESERDLTPEYIGSLILGELKKTAQLRLQKEITLGVMSVPAEFDEQQINATRKAAELAGFEILRFITEPTAAALAYGLHTLSVKKQTSTKEDKTSDNYIDDMTMAMIVDLGGGTLDVSVLSVQGGMFITQSLAGNNKLGGQDFNERLHQHCHKEIRKYLKETLKLKQEIDLDNADLDAQLRAGVEVLKRDLTRGKDATIEISLPSQVTGLNDLHDYKINVDREAFEFVNRDLFAAVLEPIRRALTAVDMTPAEIDVIVLVGGSTRVPRVRQLISGHFGGRTPDTRVQPELAVTIGVATQAGVIGGAWPLAVGAIESPATARPAKINV